MCQARQEPGTGYKYDQASPLVDSGHNLISKISNSNKYRFHLTMRFILIAFMAMIGAALAADKAPPTVRVYARPTSAFLTVFRLLQANPASKMAVLETVLADSAWYDRSHLL
jgi:hypothetical protein